jgi:hypothetical protein
MTIRFLSRRRIVFWVGATLAGLPSLLAPELSLLTRLLRALSMGFGLSGIVFIMLSATKRLEKKQAERAPSTWPVLKKDGAVRQQAAQTHNYKPSTTLKPRTSRAPCPAPCPACILPTSPGPALSSVFAQFDSYADYVGRSGKLLPKLL